MNGAKRSAEAVGCKNTSAERRSRWTTGEYSCTTPCWSRGTEEARLAERWLSVQGRKVTLLFQGKKG
ncbi:hypothetical protein L2E82_52667 [Cichorium intybus]|nr:hypothetical protein L2E82_52667 [Cichorium intybus]